MSGVIYYKTKYGSTEDYAKWLAEDVGFELKNIRKRPGIGSEKVVVIGSSLMVGKVTAADWIKKNWNKMKSKKVALFCVGGTKIGSQEREDIIVRSLPKDIINGMKIFHLPGRIDHKKMNFLMSKMVKSFAKYEEDEEEKRRAIEGYDDVNRTNLKEIISYLNEL